MKLDEITVFLEKYAADEHTQAEHQQFIDWLKNAPISDVERFTAEYNRISLKRQPPAADVDPNLIFQIEKALDQFELGNKKTINTGKSSTFIRRIHYGSVAAILIISLSGYLLYTMLAKEEKPAIISVPAKSLANEVLPGRNQARLTLGDGSMISLDDTKNGKLASPGGTQISKLANGQVVYSVVDINHQEILSNTLTTPRGGQFRLTLPDGSIVWLNSASSITYPTAFAGKERKVNVTGEAYFEIAHDASKPFLVSVNGMAISVLGTHFNINAYSDEGAIKTTLLQGSIRLSSAGMATLLKPGQQAQVVGRTFTLVNDVDLEEVVAWKNGYFSFTKADLQTVMRQIARWYDVEITYEGTIPDRQFGGKISRNSNVTEVLKILQETKVHFRIDGRNIVVTP